MQKISKINYDYVVIGSGLSGLLIASQLSQSSANIKVALVESTETFGGHHRKVETPIGPISNGVSFLPSSELSRKALNFLSTVIGAEISTEASENHAVTFDSGSIRPFVGFGNHSPDFYEELSYFLASEKIDSQSSPFEWTTQAFAQFRGDFFPQNYVTKFIQEEELITGAIVNGQKLITGQNFIYTGPIKILKNLLPEGVLSPRALHKVAKGRYWTAVGLDLVHANTVTENTSVHILNGTTDDDIGPCAGFFHKPIPSQDSTPQASQWISFMTAEEAEDSETLATALKKIRKQIKRAYPDALENLLFDRIVVIPDYSGDGELRLTASGSIPNLPNLFIGNGAVHPHKNLIGSILQAEFICSALGFTTSPETSEMTL